MFTGLIEEIGTVLSTTYEGTDARLCIDAPLVSASLAIGDSISVNGVCQTVVATKGTSFEIISVPETLGKTTLGKLQKNDPVNLERAATLATRLGGHIILGHIDEVGTLEHSNALTGSWEYFFRISEQSARYTAPRGSLAINGVSLTIADVAGTLVKVAIIPHTHEYTTFHSLREGDHVNIETDILAKYVARLLGADISKHTLEQLSTLSNV